MAAAPLARRARRRQGQEEGRAGIPAGAASAADVLVEQPRGVAPPLRSVTGRLIDWLRGPAARAPDPVSFVGVGVGRRPAPSAAKADRGTRRCCHSRWPSLIARREDKFAAAAGNPGCWSALHVRERHIMKRSDTCSARGGPPMGCGRRDGGTAGPARGSVGAGRPPTLSAA